MHSYVLNKNIIDNLFILTNISTNYRYLMLKHEKSLHSMSIINLIYQIKIKYPVQEIELNL